MQKATSLSLDISLLSVLIILHVWRLSAQRLSISFVLCCFGVSIYGGCLPNSPPYISLSVCFPRIIWIDGSLLVILFSFPTCVSLVSRVSLPLLSWPGIIFPPVSFFSCHQGIIETCPGQRILQSSSSVEVSSSIKYILACERTRHGWLSTEEHLLTQSSIPIDAMQRVSNLISLMQDMPTKQAILHIHKCTSLCNNRNTHKTFPNCPNQSEPLDHFPRARIRRP